MATVSNCPLVHWGALLHIKGDSLLQIRAQVYDGQGGVIEHDDTLMVSEMSWLGICGIMNMDSGSAPKIIIT